MPCLRHFWPVTDGQGAALANVQPMGSLCRKAVAMNGDVSTALAPLGGDYFRGVKP